MHNVLAEFYSHKWAIAPDWLLNMQSIVEKWAKGESRGHTFEKSDQPQAFLAFEEGGTIYAIEAAKGFGSSQRNGTAVIPLIGPMIKRADWISEACGLASSETVISLISQANADPNVSAILLHVDSPGGTVDGTEELARVVKSSAKPISVFVDGMAASAAYWVAAQAKHITLKGETSEVGSIGVLTTHVDQSSALEREGIKVTYLTSSRAVNKVVGPDTAPLSEEDRAAIVSHLDTIHNIFISNVKAGRRGQLTTGKEDIFTGKMYNGFRAVELGMANEVGTLETAIRHSLNQGKTKENKAEMKTLLAFLQRNKNASTTESTETVETEETPVVSKEELTRIDAEMAANATTIQTLTSEKSEIQAKYDTLTGEHEALKTENASLAAENARLKAGPTEQTPSGDPAQANATPDPWKQAAKELAAFAKSPNK